MRTLSHNTNGTHDRQASFVLIRDKDWNPEGVEAAAGEILETNEPHGALPSSHLQAPPTSIHLVHILSQTFAPTKISSGLSKFDAVTNSEPDLRMYVTAIIVQNFHFLQD